MSEYRNNDYPNLSEAVQNTIDKIQNYTNNNKLKLNVQKTKIMVVSKQNRIKENFHVNLGGKDIYQQSQVTILGNRLTENLSWDNQVEKVLITKSKQ